MNAPAQQRPNPPAGEVVVVSVTTPDEAVAEQISRGLVEERLAACVQVGGPIRSTYRWQGAIETDTEWMVSIKTTSDQLDAMVAAVRRMHPAEVPEIVATPAVGGNADYLRWVAAETG